MTRIVVVGDSLLDRDLDGDVRRLAPEGPVPVVEEPAATARPGGAALVAVLAARSGDEVTLVTAVGRDAPGAELRSMVAKAGVRCIDLGLDGPTPEKMRIRSAGRSLLRVDRGCAAAAPGSVPAAAAEAIAGADCVTVADYGRGIAALPELRDCVAAAGRRVPLVWDPHPQGALPVAGAVVTPNAAEAAAATGSAPATDVAAAAQQATSLLERWNAAAAVVTLSARGAVLVRHGHLAAALPAVPAAGDSCGAGDAFAAALAGRLAAAEPLEEAAAAAVRAASAFVARGGAAGWAVPIDDGASPLADRVAASVRAAGGTVVATGGCFDLLHAGHLSLLEGARALGDCLIVCLNSDTSARQLKGEGRPVVGQADREQLLRATRWVDAVLVFDEPTPEAALRRIRPHIWVKGGDYAASGLPEETVLAEWGGRALTVPFLEGRSTSRLIDLARRSA